MANLQKLLPELSEEGPPNGLSEINLAFLRKLAKKLAPSNQNLTDIGQVLAVKIIGHINLAKRNLLPRQFIKSERSTALFKYFRASYFGEEPESQPQTQTESQIKGSQIDGTAFAETLTSPLAIDALDWPGTPTDLIKWVSQTLGQRMVKESSQPDKGTTKAAAPWLPQIRAIGKNTLSTGWAQELFGTSTQVFTPENIAQHLASEVFESATVEPARLLDPACGAGHLLIPAAEHWLSLVSYDDKSAGQEQSKQQLNTRKRELLEKLLSEVITGLDVDHKLLQLCGFAFYLLARDQLSDLGQSPTKSLGESQDESFCELPLPRIFLSKSTAGSLTLGISRNCDRTNLQDSNNSKDCSQSEDWPQSERSSQSEDWFDLQGKPTPTLRDIVYNQIVMNPPYLSTRIMGDTTANFLKRYYPDSSGDLYTAFIELATRLLAPGGKLSMIVQQSFLSVQRYRAFRLKLLEDCHITSCLTLGLGSFSARPGEKVNSAVLTLERKETETNLLNKNSESSTTFRPRSMRVGRMENRNLSTNLIAEETALATMAAISGNPFAFDCPSVLAHCFKELPALSEIEGIAIVNGLFTCNNEKFVTLESQLSESDKHLYVPYDKGGGQKWYHQTSYRLLWPDNGETIRQYRKERGQSQSLPGEEYYFKPGLTYSYIGTTGFKARQLSENCVFDIASSAIFSNKIDQHYLLGFLNSSLTIYLLGVLNPTINFQIGDLRRLPFSAPTAEISTHIADLAKEAVTLMRHWHENQPTTQAAELIERERKIQEEIDTVVYQLYKIDKATKTIISDNQWVAGSRKKLLK